MKIYLYNTNFHKKNKNFIKYYIKNFHICVNSIEEADIIYSPNEYIEIEKYPNKKFIFGPHFSVFPNNIVERFINVNNNSLYIQPSQPSVDTWQNEFNFKNLPMRSIPFGVDTEKFSPDQNINKTNVIVYYKQRDPNEFNFLTTFLDNKNISYRVFNYLEKYKEDDFLNYLKTRKYGIVLGRHESQGFAIQEMLSCNVPLLVWGVKLRKQEYPYRKEYENIKTEVSTVPYWSNSCGELFYTKEKLESSFNTFISNINTYEPRDFILNNLSFEKCSQKWNNLINSL